MPPSTRIKIPKPVKPIKRAVNRISTEGPLKKRTRIIRIPSTGIPTPYFEPENWHTVSEIGRTKIFVSKPNKGMKEKWFVLKDQSITDKPHLYAALDPVGEARMQRELERRLEGSPVGVAKPIALIRTTDGTGKDRKTFTQIISE
ncbi:MAG: hypothetical protein Q7K42_00300, partial [Candidatus Diapherotrites archaeon]|nr:hypothetical protein [Candidatus Diapherotrites archaeon]